MSDSLRIDKWLWFARFAKSRSLAAGWVEDGLVARNDQPVTKPSAEVKPGDRISLPAGPRRRRIVQVLALGSRRGPAPEAQGLYTELGLVEVVEPAIDPLA